MLKSSRTCESCSRMLLEQRCLEQAVSQKGLDVAQTGTEFMNSVHNGCTICVAVYDLANRWEDIEDEVTGSFRRAGEDDKLVKNVQFRLPGQDGSKNHLLNPLASGTYNFDTACIALGSLDSRDHINLYFDVEAADDNPAAEWVKTRPLDPDVARPAAFFSARSWLHTCLTNHNQCSSHHLSDETGFVPRRLIELQGESIENVRVNLLLAGEGLNSAYAALSYCWGSGQAFTLTRANIEIMLKEIQISLLPQTIQDAIAVVYRLGIRFLWVDSLCILQDSRSDMDEQIAVMDQVYQCAIVTIAAASAERSAEGFLQKRSFEGDFAPYTNSSMLQFPCPNGEQGNIVLREQRVYYPRIEPLSRRAWALQERVLSPRILTYGSWQVWWECAGGIQCDRGKLDNILHFEDSNVLELTNIATYNKSLTGHTKSDKAAILSVWGSVIYHYTGRGLSVEADKLPAISGIASKLSTSLDCPYLAGLWKDYLREGMKWQAGSSHTYRPADYCAPTWSWASVIGELFYSELVLSDDLDGDHKSLAKHTTILGSRVTLANPSVPFGRVVVGTLTIRAMVQVIQWNGAESIPRKGLDPALVPDEDPVIGSPLFPENIVALAKPDTDEEILYYYNAEPETSADAYIYTGPPIVDENTSELQKVHFYMGRERKGLNEITRPITCMVLDNQSALMLTPSERPFFHRVGLMEFKSSETLNDFFEGCKVQTVVIR